MPNVALLLAALADPTRLGALHLLWDGREHCVCELTTRLGTAPSRMSRHMGVLRQVGLVVARRDAQWVRYRVAPALPLPQHRLVAAALALMPPAAPMSSPPQELAA